MFIIFIVLTIILPFIIYYGVQKETAEKIKYIDKYYFTLKYAIKNLPKGYMPYDDVQEMVDGVLEKHNGIYPDYKDLLYKYDSITTELQVHKDKEDKIREYIKQNILWLDSIDNQVYTINGYNSDRIAIVKVDELLQILKERYEK